MFRRQKAGWKQIGMIAVCLACLPATAAHAAAVTSWSATDGYSAVPLAKGSFILDTHLGMTLPGTVSTFPTLNFLAGVADGVELGVGTYADIIYPWARIGGLSLGTDKLKGGFMVGADLPSYNSTLPEVAAGVSGLIDFTYGDLLTNLNLGYRRGFKSGTNSEHANLNVTWPWLGLTWYEEQFINYPLSGGANGGLRGSVAFPLRTGLTFDVSPAVLWNHNAGATTWLFNPNVGFTYTF